MGAWGIKALESDAGLDVVDLLRDFSVGKEALELGAVIDEVKAEGLLGQSFEEVDFLYDNSAMALAELYLEFRDSGKLDYDDEEEDGVPVFARIKSFSADRAALDFLLRYLTDIRDGVPDADGEREIVELWQDSDVWEGWHDHLLYLIGRLEQEKERV